MKKLFISKWTLEKSFYMIRKILGAHTTLEMLHILRPASESAEPALRFSPRGKEVFMLIKEGLTTKRISERLGMGVSHCPRCRPRGARRAFHTGRCNLAQIYGWIA